MTAGRSIWRWQVQQLTTFRPQKFVGIDGVHHLNHLARGHLARSVRGIVRRMTFQAAHAQGGREQPHRAHEFIHGNAFEHLDVLEGLFRICARCPAPVCAAAWAPACANPGRPQAAANAAPALRSRSEDWRKPPPRAWTLRAHRCPTRRRSATRSSLQQQQASFASIRSACCLPSPASCRTLGSW